MPGASSRTLARLFRAETGLSFRQWRQRARMTEARDALTPNTVHLSVWSLYIAGWVFWDRQRWRVFLLAFRPAFVSATTSASA